MKINFILGVVFFLFSGYTVFSKVDSADFKANLVQEYNGEMYDLHYHRIELEIDPAVLFLKGCVTSGFTVKSGSTFLTFDLSDDLLVDSVVYHRVNTGFVHQSNVLNIDISPISVSQLDSVKIYYHGVPSGGLFFTAQFDLNKFPTGIPLAFTSSEPDGAHYWWPCKESLSDKIDSVDIIVTAPVLYKVASNGILYNEKNEGAYTVTHWKHRYPIATYLIAVAISDYKIYRDHVPLSSGKNLEILNYVFASHQQIAKVGTQELIPIIQLFDTLFGPYPFQNEKYGHAQAWTGMENQTMSFVYGFDISILSHELAHQWFGNQVTCGTWQDLWLNEGLATFAAYLTAEAGLNQEETALSLRTKYVNGCTYYPNLIVHVTDTMNGLFTLGVYSKSAIVLYMLREKIGKEAYNQGIRNYLASHNQKYGFAKEEDLKHYLENTSGQDLSLFFAEWIHESGFPVVDVKWNQALDHTVSLYMPQTQTSSVSFYHDLPLHLSFRGASQEEVYDTVLYNVQGHEYAMFNTGFTVVEIKFDTLKQVLAQYSATMDNTLELVPVFISSIVHNPTHRKSIPVSLTFGEMMVGFSVGDLIVEGAIVEDFQGDGVHYTFNLVPNAVGEVAVTLLGNTLLSVTNKKNAGARFDVQYNSEKDQVPTYANSAIHVYPVPTSSILNILSENERIEHYELIDIMGRSVFNVNTNDQHVQVDISNLKSGIYVLLISMHGNNFFREVVVKGDEK